MKSSSLCLFLLILFISGCNQKSNSRVICLPTAVFKPGVSGGTVTTTYDYDANGKIISSFEIYVNGATTQTSFTHTYDSKGNLNAITSPNLTYTFTWNTNNLLITYVESASGVIATTTYSYNSGGQITSKTLAYNNGNPGSTSTYTYPNSVSKNPMRVVTVPTTGQTVTTDYEYDDKINMEKFYGRTPVESDNNITKETRSQTSGTTVITYAYVYNENGYPIAISSSLIGNTAITYACK